MNAQISLSQFISIVGTEDFSRDALEALYNFFEEVGFDGEIDSVALRCEFCEYESVEDVRRDYDLDIEVEEGEEPTWEEVVDELNSTTLALPLHDHHGDITGVVIQVY